MTFDSQNEQYNTLLRALLHQNIFDYFKTTKVDIYAQSIDIYLNELNQSPSEYSKENLISKGFYNLVSIQDFPIRERAVYLHVRRRKWLVQSTGNVVSKKWDLTAKGSR